MIISWSVKQQNVDIISSRWFITKVETWLEDKGERVLASEWHVGGWQSSELRRSRRKSRRLG